MTSIQCYPLLLACLALLTVGSALAEQSLEEIMDEFIDTPPSWLEVQAGCPADQLTNDANWTSSEQGMTCAHHPRECIERCRKGEVSSCFPLAASVQQRENMRGEGNDPTAPSVLLFQLACTQGSAMACTNQAALMLHIGTPSDETVACVLRTMLGTCELDEPFGCAMASMLQRDSDPDAARLLGDKACRLAPLLQPCRLAQEVRELMGES